MSGDNLMAPNGWRPMTAKDITSVAHISDTVHGRYTERAEVYAERLSLYPAGCHVLEEKGGIAGYLICHPWTCDAPPELGAMLGAIPMYADCLYLHDLALLPAARGTGAGRDATKRVVATALTEGFREIRLVAVNGAESFWAAQGFVAVDADGWSTSYGDGAFLMRRMIVD